MLSYSPFDKVILRCPRFSLLSLDRIDHSIDHPEFKQGVLLSRELVFREFYERLKISDRKNSNLYSKIVKYHSRSCTRCTPFATFAGSCVLNVVDQNSESEIIISFNNSQKHTRIDNGYLSSIINSLENIPQIKENVVYCVNNSLYDVGDEYRYISYVGFLENRQYFLTSIQKSISIDYVIDACKNGYTYRMLSNNISVKLNTDIRSAEQFVDMLIDKCIITSELQTKITGEDPLLQLILNLNKENVLYGEKFIHFRKNIRDFDGSILHYEAIINDIKHFVANQIETESKLQTDTYFNSISKGVNYIDVKKIIDQTIEATIYAYPLDHPDLIEFRKKFREKYNEEEIPLSIALDSDIGIGYSTWQENSIPSIRFGNKQRPSVHNFDAELQNLRQFCLNKYLNFLEGSGHYIEVYEEEIEALKKAYSTEDKLPNNMCIVGSLFKKCEQNSDNKFSFFLHRLQATSGINLLGRFSGGDDNMLQVVKEIAKFEENRQPECIFADIIHVPHPRVANVSHHPLLREYEIPFISLSGAPKERQISISDILVSVTNRNEVVLRSKSLDRQIVPRLSNAHNYVTHSLPIYKFLCDLQHQHKYQPMSWDWHLLSTQKFLPRVVYKDLILSKAKWTIFKSEMIDIPERPEDKVEYFDKYRAKHRIPVKVVLLLDVELVVDFSKIEYINIFIEYIYKRKSITLEEFLFSYDNCLIVDETGEPHTNEVIIPIRKDIIYDRQKSSEVGLKILRDNFDVPRKFGLDSEWLYFKIYCGENTLEKILINYIFPFVTLEKINGLFDKFFFIRYVDDSNHLRIRFYSLKKENLSILKNRFIELLSPLVNKRIIDKLVIDTYNRELERYHFDLIEETESIFYYDSVASLNLLTIIHEDSPNYSRILMALMGVDYLLDDFNFTFHEKVEIVARKKKAFFREFGGSLELQRHLNASYRQIQKDIFIYMGSGLDDNLLKFNISYVLKARSEQNSKILALMALKRKDADIKEELLELVPSYIHMFLNRISQTTPRQFELMIYHYLDKYYSSSIAIAMGKKNNKT